MSEIKKGDWVYSEMADIVFCLGREIKDTGGLHRLTPMKSTEGLECGAKLAVIGNCIDGPEIGSVVSVRKIDQYFHEIFIWPEGYGDGWSMESFALLPDCAQDKISRKDAIALAKKQRAEIESRLADEVEEQVETTAVPDAAQKEYDERLKKLCTIANKFKDRASAASHHYRLLLEKPTTAVHDADSDKAIQPLIENGCTVYVDDRNEIEKVCGPDDPIPYAPTEKERCDSAESATPEDKCHTETKLPQPTECPHPEWEGLWKTGFCVVKIKWNAEMARWSCEDRNGKVIMERADYKWVGPILEGWELIEPAPREARAHTKPKQEPNQWNPYPDGIAGHCNGERR
jgi:hypothetical protein